jgi:RND superfamily putative drug exporter
VFARLGAFCYDRRRLVVCAWLALLIGGLFSSNTLTERLAPAQGSDSWESVRGYDKVTETAKYGEAVSAVVDGRSVDDPQVRTAIADARADLLKLEGVGRVRDPLHENAPPLIAKDNKALVVMVDLKRGLSNVREDAATLRVERRLRAIAKDVSGTEVTVGGATVVRREVREQTRKDTALGELVALPLTLLAMVFIFGGLVAAGVPFLGAIASVFGGIVTLLGFSTFLEIDPSVLSVTTVLALGLTIDYSLLMVSRYREERATGLDPRPALERTVETAGRTIMFSAFTVATSLGGLFLFENKMFRAIGSAGVGVVLVALLVGLTLTPALLALFGRRITARAAVNTRDGLFARTARSTRRHAKLITFVVCALLLAGGLPFLHANFQNSDEKQLPRGFASRDFAELMSDRFPGGGSAPVIVVANTDTATLARWASALRRSDGVDSIGRLEQLSDGVSTIDLLPVASSRDRKAVELVANLRASQPPFAILVTGEAAVLIDFKNEVATQGPWALTFVALSTLILLFLMTGSLLVPLKALVMNTLSLSASFGALVLIFQDGHLSGLLGFESTGGLETFVPVLVFAFAFGLSMDYEVFLLARIKELYDSGMTNDEAVEVGLQRSGRIITSAALLMIIVFAGFAAGKMVSIKEMGVAMAIAVAVDATLVRCLLVPATMTMLGDLNWWAPKPLRRWHDKWGLREDTLIGELETRYHEPAVSEQKLPVRAGDRPNR